MARKVKAKKSAFKPESSFTVAGSETGRFPSSIREQVLNHARAAVLGDRQLNYGSPDDNFERIKLLWDAWLKGKAKPLEETGFNQHDISLLVILMKVARLGHTPDHFDSWADIAGYAACGAETSKNAGV